MTGSLKSAIKNKTFSLLILFGISLTAFYPTLNSAVIELDDAPLVTDLNNPLKDHSLKKLFWPCHPPTYYRPVLICSFILDSKIWEMEYSGYHLTNNLLHTLNIVIFFLIVLKLFKYDERKNEIAFFAALFFGLNPLNIESIAWISGRSDILGTFFPLLGYLFYLMKFRLRQVFVVLMVFLGILSKENAFSIIPIIVLSEFFFSLHDGKSLKSSFLNAGYWTVILALPVAVYLYLRFAGFKTIEKQIEVVASNKGNYLKEESFFSHIYALPAISAFYIKKLVFPFPLNFAISTLNVALYSSLFCIMMLAVVYSLYKKKYMFPIALVFIVTAFLPALPVALSNVAWTKYAERYLYLAVPVYAVFLAKFYIYLGIRFKKKAKLINFITVSFIAVFCIAGLNRASVWKNRYSLWQDTYQKNPDNGMVLYKYGIVLRDEKGEQYFKRAIQTARDDEWKDLSYLALSKIEVKNKNYDIAIDYYKKALDINPSLKNIDSAVKIVVKIIRQDEQNSTEYRKLLIYLYLLAYSKNPRPADLYFLTKNYGAIGDEINKQKYYDLLQEKFPKSRAAKNLFKKQGSLIEKQDHNHLDKK